MYTKHTIMKTLFLNNKFILFLILLNTLTIFLSGFEFDTNVLSLINIIDNCITVMFIIEMITKLSYLKPKGYFAEGWNVFDFILIVISIPSLFFFLIKNTEIDLSFILVFRVLRVFKTFRFFKFIPKIDELLSGVQRALKASVFILIGFIVYIFVIGVLSFSLFKNLSPIHFHDPLTSLYSIFKVFTVEGWFSIPEKMCVDISQSKAVFIHLYFVFILLTGGIFGLSLVNSIFVDAMVSDNNDGLEKKVDELNKKIDTLLAQKS